MAYYIKIRTATYSHLRFPQICPFNSNAKPQRIWELTGQTRSGFLGLPLLTPAILYYKKATVSIPASHRFVRRQHLLALYAGVLVFLPPALYVLDAMWLEFLDGYRQWLLLLPGLGLLAYIAKLWLARHAAVAYVGNETIVMRFTSREYAESFGALNGVPVERSLRKLRPLK